MKFSEVIEENSNDVNRMVSKQLRFVMVLLFLVWILNINQIFIINEMKFNRLMLVSGVILLLPTILTDIVGLKHALLKYIIVLCTIIFVSILYMYLTYHVVIMFIFPLAIASLYFDNLLTGFTIICSLGAMTFSHYFSFFIRLTKDDPFRTIYDIAVYGLFPRAIEYIALSVIIILLTSRTSKLLKTYITYSENIKQSKDSLDVIVSNTNSMFQAKNEKELAVVVFNACKCLIGVNTRIESDYQSYFGMVDNRGDFTFFMDDLKTSVIKCGTENLTVPFADTKIYIPRIYEKEEPAISIKDSYMLMAFYENYTLNAFLIIQNHFNTENSQHLKRELNVCYGTLKLAISNIRLSEDMYQTQEELVRAFAEISESKSKQTGQHIKRVSEYMKVMAKAIRLQEKEQDNLVIASMMHDIGKLMIPSEIIEKKGKLTEEEFAEMKKHVQYGFELLKYSPGRVMEIAKIVALQHHEKWNGKGYLGLKGEKIDYYSRIMAVVDVFDALISKRSYKEKWTLEDAYKEIVSQSGEHFDPAVVQLFVEHFEEFKVIVGKYPD